MRALLAVLCGWLAFAAVYPVVQAEHGMWLTVETSVSSGGAWDGGR